LSPIYIKQQTPCAKPLFREWYKLWY